MREVVCVRNFRIQVNACAVDQLHILRHRKHVVQHEKLAVAVCRGHLLKVIAAAQNPLQVAVIIDAVRGVQHQLDIACRKLVGLVVARARSGKHLRLAAGKQDAVHAGENQQHNRQNRHGKRKDEPRAHRAAPGQPAEQKPIHDSCLSLYSEGVMPTWRLKIFAK